MAHDDIWSAFAHFAPWAYGATVWDVAGRDIVTLADEAQSIVVRVNLEQYNAIAAVLGDLKLIPQHRHRRDH